MTGDRLDEAARAAWLYYVAGNTQDEIARKLGVSRQSAQRLVSLAVSEGLVKVRLEHPIGRCMELATAVSDAHGLKSCEVVPSDPEAPGTLGVARAGGAEMERHLRSRAPRILAVGTGRTLRACIEEVPGMSCPQHRIASLLGTMMSDGSSSPYNAVIRLAERVGARHYSLPLPVFVDSPEELALLHRQEPVRNIFELCRNADATFVGIGQIDENAPLLVDGFITRAEMRGLQAAGAVGEITSYAYDAEGRLIPGLMNDRTATTLLQPASERLVVGIAVGAAKAAAIRGALAGGLINALITDEATAALLV